MHPGAVPGCEQRATGAHLIAAGLPHGVAREAAELAAQPRHLLRGHCRLHEQQRARLHPQLPLQHLCYAAFIHLHGRSGHFTIT